MSRGPKVQSRFVPFEWSLFRKYDRGPFIESTKDLRDAVARAKTVEAQLASLSATDPKYEAIRREAAAYEQRLRSTYQYTSNTAPAPGTLFIDPEFQSDAVPSGHVTGDQFPVSVPATAPPSAAEALFARGRPLQTTTTYGQTWTLRTAADYRAFVAAQRKASGMPRTDGEPIAAQFVLEGGGGKGKRYPAVVTELINNGVVPVSIAGNSAGSIPLRTSRRERTRSPSSVW